MKESHAEPLIYNTTECQICAARAVNQASIAPTPYEDGKAALLIA
jgi:hypothetical protein